MGFVDTRQLDHGTAVEADLCIVGAGAAGIALAREFIGSRRRVVLVESGDLVFRQRTQRLYAGENRGVDNHPTTQSRFRMFGGSTTRWAGQCRPLRPLDFERRAAIPHSGWPFGFEALAPYYRRAQPVCNLPSCDYDPEFWSRREKNPLSRPSDPLDSLVFQFSDPKDFGRIYRDELAAAPNIEVYLNANVIRIESDAAGREVTGLQAATFNGKRIGFGARAFVLACGGIENPRLLLASRDADPAGLGNRFDLVGRFFMDHPYFLNGYYEPADPKLARNFYTIEDYDRVGREQKINAAFCLKESVLRETGLNGAALYFVRRPRYKTLPAYFSPAGRSFIHMVNVAGRKVEPDRRFGRHLSNIARGLDVVALNLGRQALESLRPRPLLGLRTILEATPNPDSRVTLTPQRDPFGLPRVAVDWRLNRSDLEGFRRLMSALREAFARLGLGRLVEDEAVDAAGWPQSMSGGKHHMGTTRMHDDPKKGVVDAACRVHGMGNLYVAGSSLFPTGGSVNPTLTIVALAIRLADRLKQDLA